MRRRLVQVGLAAPIAAGVAALAAAVVLSDDASPSSGPPVLRGPATPVSAPRATSLRPAGPAAAASPAADARGPVAPVAAASLGARDPVALAALEPRALERALRALAPEEARALLPELLAGCRDAARRQALLRVDRRLKLLASPRALADAVTPDLAAIAAAQAHGALREQSALAADPARPEAVRAAAVEALARAGVEDARARLLDLARDPSPSTRALAASGLARKAPCLHAERALVLLAGDPAPEVRRAALLALSAFPGGATVAAQRLAVEADPGLRAAALQTLTTAGGASELPGLLALARTAPVAERPRALRAADAVARRTGSPWPDDLPRSAGAPLRLMEPSAPATPAGEAP